MVYPFTVSPATVRICTNSVRRRGVIVAACAPHHLQSKASTTPGLAGSTPKCVHCGEGHAAWACSSENVPSDVKAMRAKVEHYRGRKPNWYDAYVESVARPDPSAPAQAPVTSAPARRPIRKPKSKQPGKNKGKSETPQIHIDFMFQHQQQSAPAAQSGTASASANGGPSGPALPAKRPFSALASRAADGPPAASADKAAPPEGGVAAPKRPRGRPKGSKNVKRRPPPVPSTSTSPAEPRAALEAGRADAAKQPSASKWSVATQFSQLTHGANPFGIDFTRHALRM